MELPKLKLHTFFQPCNSHCLGFILFVCLCMFLSFSTLSNACDVMSENWIEKSVDERTNLADAVISGKVLRQIHPSIRNQTDFMYAADVEIYEIYKGYRHFANVSSLRPSSGQNNFRILGFGERKNCYSEAHENQEYIFFLTSYSMPTEIPGFEGNKDGGLMGLTAKYDDYFGALVRLNKKHEELVLETLGWKSWSTWSSCPVSCGGGIQRRRRLCVKDVADACEGLAEETRNCNEFGCTGLRNLLQILPLSFFPKGVRRTPLRWQSYRLRAFTDLKTSTNAVFPHGFPQEFSILLSVRPKYAKLEESELFVLVITDENGDLDFGIKFSDVPSVIYSERIGETKILHTQSFSEYKMVHNWHTMAFSVKGSTVSLHVDCSTVIKHELAVPIMVDSRGMTAIGNPFPKKRDIFFEGDVEQLVLIGNPDAAQMQCVEPPSLIPTLSSALDTPWNYPSDSEIPYQLLIPPPHFKTWQDHLPTSTPPEGPATPRSEVSNGIWIQDTDTGRDVWFQITIPPHLATNLVPLAREVNNDIITPSSGSLDINMLPPPDNNEPFLPRAPANYFVGGNPQLADGVGFAGLEGSGGESINNGFGELTSGTTAQESEKSFNKDGKDGGHDVPFDVTLPQETFWSRGDAPPEGFIPKPKPTVLVNNPTTTIVASTTKLATTTKIATTTATPTTTLLATTAVSTSKPEPFVEDYSSDFSSIFPKEESHETDLVVTTKLPPPATTTKEFDQTTKSPSTTTVEGVLDNKISDIDDDVKIPIPKIDISSEDKDEELSNALLNDEGLNDEVIQEVPKSRPVLDSSGDSEDTETSIWSSWSTCSKSCDSGIRYRFTFCTQGSKLPDCIARNGRGVASQTMACRVRDCEAPRVRWSAWSECSRSCGEGLQTRMALCGKKSSIPECSNGRSTAVQRRVCVGSQCKGACSQNCQNGGQCQSDGSCACRGGYAGPQCQIKLFTSSRSRCNPQCTNGGTCVTSSIPPRCACKPGYTGLACESAVCRQRCQNGGRCVAPDTCNCRSGYQGYDCTQPVCRLRCQHGGSCVRPDMCRCPIGYRGPQCQIYYCRQRCRNGGRCVGPDKCSCTAGYSGAVCSTPTNRPIRPQWGADTSGVGNSYSLSAYSKSCRLTSYTGTYSQSYVKPEFKTINYSCGRYLRETCSRTSMVYSRSYRTQYRTFYKMTCNEPT